MFDNPKVIIKARNRNLNFRVDISLYHNVNIVLGDSGTGKTMLFSDMSDPGTRIEAKDREGKDVHVEFVLNWATGDTYLSNLKLSGGSDRKIILILDDIKGFLMNDRLIDRLKTYRDKTYILFIGRDLKDMYNRRISCFSSALYVVDYSKKPNVVLNKVVSDEKLKLNDIRKYYGSTNTCVSECMDDSGEYMFLKNFFSNVYCSNGRLNVIKTVRSILLEKGSELNSLYIFVDMCSYGTELYDLVDTLSGYCGIDFHICEQYSYEYTVLEMIGKTTKIVQDTDFCICDNGNKASFEKYVAEILSKERFGGCGFFRKSGVPRVFRDPNNTCDNNCVNIRVSKSCRKYKSTKGKLIRSLVVNSDEAKIYALCSDRGYGLCSE